MLTETEPSRLKTENKETLSKREKEILRYLSQGKSIKEIADLVHLSPFTVLTHRKNISSKTGIKTLAGLTVYSISIGLISIDEMSE
jgi:DNA-binding CsgD family transcriptional regulator